MKGLAVTIAALMPVAAWAEPLIFEGGRDRFELQVEEAAPVFMDDKPSLRFRLDAAGSAALADLTAAMIGETLTVSLCGRVLVEAKVQERIGEGRGMVNLASAEAAVAAAAVMQDDGSCADLEAALAE